LKANQAIGVFDSGIGGLTVANAIKESLPNEKIIYFGDTQHLPYGTKSQKNLVFFAERIVKFLMAKNCKVIVVACNTASALALPKINKLASNQCKVFNVIDPVVEYIKTNKNIQKLGIIGTTGTILSRVYQKKINSVREDLNTVALPTPLLATLIEENKLDLSGQNIIKSYLSNPIFNSIDSLILGCTHYPLIEPIINKFYKSQVNLINSAEYVSMAINKFLKREQLQSNLSSIPNHEFYISDYTKSFQEKTHFFFKSSIILQEENLFN